MQRKDDQLFYPYFKHGSVNYPIHSYLKIDMCYGLDIFSRSASAYKMKIRKILDGLLVYSLVYTPVCKILVSWSVKHASVM